MTNTISAVHRIGLIGLAVLLAWGTYLLVERPLRKRNTPRTAVILGAGMVVIMAAGIVFWTGLVKSRQSSPEFETIVSAMNDWDYPSRNLELYSRFFDYSFYRKAGKGSSTVLFVGDSYMEQYVPRIEMVIDQQPESPSAIFATKGSCRFATPVLAREQRDCTGKLATIERLIQDPQIDTVVFAQQWLGHARMVDDEAVAASFEERLASVPAGKRKFVILNIPAGEGFGPADMLTGSRLGKLAIKPGNYRDAAFAMKPLEALNRRIREIAARQGAVIIDPFDHLCDARGCRITDSQGRPAYKDRSHLTATFAREAGGFVDVVLMPRD